MESEVDAPYAKQCLFFFDNEKYTVVFCVWSHACFDQQHAMPFMDYLTKY